ncbi:phospholipid scramblase 4-like isoform X1 [Herpailurus yagouaroundi]|uniref:phospholipid scramblase 4-like isoform X1 n=1 Tax=Herpailurus yagouaroundi TaxID=1608482 RepID=UPI001AD6F275|nr:phospholipid scramblase 4-like isoform X1 [Puma yagouaroundi]XP_040336350.1 phospholipid scramblase 4-like isoform X1 [Puma yagouaroundi]
MPEPVPVPNCPPGLEDLVAQLEMQWPPGVTAGFALEHWNPCRMLYSIQSKKKEKVMGVRGPRSTHGWGSDSAFEGSPERQIHGIGSHAYEDREIPQSAVGKLETQRSWWYSPVQVQV